MGFHSHQCDSEQSPKLKEKKS
ncbi:hypothetical protein Gogos_003261 [Gossypium gossypioides]|uniref:Uncharacterized protein n=1 Tax=Gossypium gossypioides TaxID=34282 RepID=A0A7J9CLM4_GOSGO|nr:hypothetical protein [Gossypium gossypioides]